MPNDLKKIFQLIAGEMDLKPNNGFSFEEALGCSIWYCQHPEAPIVPAILNFAEQYFSLYFDEGR